MRSARAPAPAPTDRLQAMQPANAGTPRSATGARALGGRRPAAAAPAHQDAQVRGEAAAELERGRRAQQRGHCDRQAGPAAQRQQVHQPYALPRRHLRAVGVAHVQRRHAPARGGRAARSAASGPCRQSRGDAIVQRVRKGLGWCRAAARLQEGGGRLPAALAPRPPLYIQAHRVGGRRRGHGRGQAGLVCYPVHLPAGAPRRLSRSSLYHTFQKQHASVGTRDVGDQRTASHILLSPSMLPSSPQPSGALLASSRLQHPTTCHAQHCAHARPARNGSDGALARHASAVRTNPGGGSLPRSTKAQGPRGGAAAAHAPPPAAAPSAGTLRRRRPRARRARPARRPAAARAGRPARATAQPAPPRPPPPALLRARPANAAGALTGCAPDTQARASGGACRAGPAPPAAAPPAIALRTGLVRVHGPRRTSRSRTEPPEPRSARCGSQPARARLHGAHRVAGAGLRQRGRVGARSPSPRRRARWGRASSSASPAQKAIAAPQRRRSASARSVCRRYSASAPGKRACRPISRTSHHASLARPASRQCATNAACAEDEAHSQARAHAPRRSLRPGSMGGRGHGPPAHAKHAPACCRGRAGQQCGALQRPAALGSTPPPEPEGRACSPAPSVCAHSRARRRCRSSASARSAAPRSSCAAARRGHSRSSATAGVAVARSHSSSARCAASARSKRARLPSAPARPSPVTVRTRGGCRARAARRPAQAPVRRDAHRRRPRRRAAGPPAARARRRRAPRAAGAAARPLRAGRRA